MFLLPSCSNINGYSYAYNAVYEKDGNLNTQAYAAAINEMFKSGTSFEKLREFTKHSYVWCKGRELQENDTCRIYIEKKKDCPYTFIMHVTSKKGVIESSETAYQEPGVCD